MVVQREERFKARKANDVWSLDFVSDELGNSQRFRILTVIDVINREALATEVGFRLRGEDVVKPHYLGLNRSAMYCFSQLDAALRYGRTAYINAGEFIERCISATFGQLEFLKNLKSGDVMQVEKLPR